MKTEILLKNTFLLFPAIFLTSCEPSGIILVPGLANPSANITAAGLAAAVGILLCMGRLKKVARLRF